ncbi:hypothetical protein RRF57_013002 [Xylaria bambusicola]|uniref:Uncharacterized protein n=1 Tax=Xylaria bambusicola TaxID=326684 RepID=A0AAN7UQV2_9PEZI
MCVADMPTQVTKLPDKCTTDACEVDSRGYCKVRRAVDRTCFCHNISYDSCGGLCQIFETRIDYIKWLHGLCGKWTMKPSKSSDVANHTRVAPIRAVETCPSNEWKFGSLALVNLSVLLAAFLSMRTRIHRLACCFSWHICPRSWVFKGVVIASLQLLANWFNMFLVQKSPGYENVPLVQSILFWCTMPRPTWVLILLVSVKSLESTDVSSLLSFLFAETILQFLSSYYMIMTVNYGRRHNFYFGGLERVERGEPAIVMYAGALVWLAATPWISGSEAMPLKRGERRRNVYGTFSGKGINTRASHEGSVALYGVVAITLLLWIAQWFFWGGFLGLSLEEFCPPKLGVLTAVWVAISFACITLGATALDQST